MITIDEKLYITKEVNNIVVSFAKKVVLKKLLLEFSFTSENENREVTDLIKTVGYYNGDLPDTEVQLELIDLINSFLKELTKEELTSLHFWVINEKYMKYLDETEVEENYAHEDFDFKFGRELAHRLYDPENTELEDDLDEALKYLFINFASEFDFSLIDKQTTEDILETINSYYC